MISANRLRYLKTNPFGARAICSAFSSRRLPYWRRRRAPGKRLGKTVYRLTGGVRARDKNVNRKEKRRLKKQSKKRRTAFVSIKRHARIELTSRNDDITYVTRVAMVLSLDVGAEYRALRLSLNIRKQIRYIRKFLAYCRIRYSWKSIWLRMNSHQWNLTLRKRTRLGR